jgi:hypothetical protein
VGEPDRRPPHHPSRAITRICTTRRTLSSDLDLLVIRLDPVDDLRMSTLDWRTPAIRGAHWGPAALTPHWSVGWRAGALVSQRRDCCRPGRSRRRDMRHRPRNPTLHSGRDCRQCSRGGLVARGSALLLVPVPIRTHLVAAEVRIWDDAMVRAAASGLLIADVSAHRRIRPAIKDDHMPGAVGSRVNPNFRAPSASGGDCPAVMT